MQSRKTVTIYRWIVFLLAAFYCLRTIFYGNYDGFGGPFRYLTIWALFLSFFAASRMLALSEGRSTKRWEPVVGMVAVINAMVVFLYWKLYFADPLSVTNDGQLGQWWLEYYMHALGPLLQWIDVVFIHRAFRKPGKSILWLLGVISLYVLWAELLVGPLNESPVGSVTSGLPYRFLNNLELPDRAVFYGSNLVVAMIFLGGFVAISWAVRRVLPRAEP